MISPNERYVKVNAHILGYRMGYVDERTGDPIGWAWNTGFHSKI